jgi:hypothetical protein
VSRLLDGEPILVHLETGFFYSLGGVGARAWELLEGGATARDLVATLLPEYEVDRQRLTRDVEALLDELELRELIVEQSRAPDRPE